MFHTNAPKKITFWQQQVEKFSRRYQRRVKAVEPAPDAPISIHAKILAAVGEQVATWRNQLGQATKVREYVRDEIARSLPALRFARHLTPRQRRAKIANRRCLVGRMVKVVLA